MSGVRPAAGLRQRLGRDRSGVAMIEFALSLVFLVPIAMVGIELANLAVVTLRLNQLAMMVSDNVARYRGSIDEAQVDEVMTGVAFAGRGIGFGQQGRVIVSTLESNGQTGTQTGYKITWQRCFGAKNVSSSYGLEGAGATDATLASGMGPSANKVKPVDNSALIFAELRYTYRPIVGTGFMPARELTSLQSFTVRDRSSQTLTNTTNMTDAQRRLCDAAHLSAT
ncbi:TadE/TadG family type IV pilus assembly protein [Sphingomonas endophytica]|uniref:TadE/TadG family type IV pilus assembly protein n=2 Tax=Sphingomonas endophytica TaxID=869719 RepID=UPI001610460C|nr:pilus assembly protein [Sphingomonas endophytica]